MDTRIAPVPRTGQSLWEMVSSGLITEDDVDERGAVLTSERRLHGNDLCVICMDRHREYAIVPCFHMCLCSTCVVRVVRCPLCRERAHRIQRIYF